MLSGAVKRRLRQGFPILVAERGGEREAFEVMANRVHLPVGVDPQFGVHRLVKHVKGRTGPVLRAEFSSLRSRPCQGTNRYFVATVGGAPLGLLKRDVERQEGR